MTNIKTNILQFVENNKISMIPRWKFVLYFILGIISLCFSFVALIFVGSLIIFVLSVHGFMYLPVFDLRELTHSIRAIPIILFLLTMFFMFIVEVLVRKYSFTCKKPILITLLSLTIVSILLSYLVTLTPVHGNIRRYAKDHHLDFIAHEYDRPLPLRESVNMTVVRGIVASSSLDNLVLKMPDDTVLVVYASTTVDDFNLLEKGEEVVIFGHIVNDKFEALKIKNFDSLPF